MLIQIKLANIARELAALDARRQSLLAERARLTQELIATDGWKGAATTLGGISRTRVYAIASRWPRHRSP